MIIIYIFLLLKPCLALDYDFGKEYRFDYTVRDHSIIVTNEGYYPNHISLFRYEKLRIFLTSTIKKPTCLIISEKKVFLSTSKGKISEILVSFDEAGEFQYFCPTGNIRGRITVLERESDKKRTRERKIASIKKNSLVKIWRPQEVKDW